MPTMSSSFLKPSVTPVTAFATRLRASPWNLPRPGSSRSVFATSDPFSCSNNTPGGMYWRSLPFGPCTSTAPGATLTLTPLGIAIGFFPIRDMTYTQLAAAVDSRLLPHVTEHFPAYSRLARGAARHHPARRRQDVGSKPAEHRWHFVDTHVDAAAGTADAFDTRNHALPVRSVLQKEANELPGLLPLLGHFLD